MGALLPELGHCPALILRILLRAQNVAPAAVRPLVDGGPGGPLPDDAAERGGRRGMRLHVVEAATLQNGWPAILLDTDVKEGGDPARLAGKIALQVVEVQEKHVGQLSNLP